MDIKKLRITEKNKLHSDLLSCESNIKGSIETIKRLKFSNFSENNSKRIQDLEQKLISLQTKASDIKLRISDISSGKLDSELLHEIEQNTKNQKISSHLASKKRNIQQIEKDHIEIQLQKHFTSERNVKRSEKWQEKDMQKSYDIFCKKNSSIPPYILQNLKKMPNNRGYIWKDIWCFGELPSEKNQPVIMINNAKGNNLIIEYHHDCIKTFKKNYKNKKELINSIPRTPLLSSL